jgi:beta-glucosidase
VIKKYFELVDSPEEADVALVFIESPKGGTGYSRDDVAAGGNGYVPISLQYNPYKAEFARETSIAGGSTFEDFTNRSYKGKKGSASNIFDLKMVTETKAKMGEKPVVVIVDVANPMVFAEIEPAADAILIHCGVQDQAILDIATGDFEPSGLLPFQMPANMKTVDEQLEDAPRDMDCYTDIGRKYLGFRFRVELERCNFRRTGEQIQIVNLMHD